jgi:hypothetical protein
MGRLDQRSIRGNGGRWFMAGLGHGLIDRVGLECGCVLVAAERWMDADGSVRLSGGAEVGLIFPVGSWQCAVMLGAVSPVVMVGGGLWLGVLDWVMGWRSIERRWSGGRSPVDSR